MTLRQTKEEAYELVQQGKNYRDIAKIEFLVDGRKKRFSISQIAKIVKEFANGDDENKDSITSILFSMFNEGKSPTEVVIETGYKPEFVDTIFKHFTRFENEVPVPRSFIDKLHELCDRVDDDKETKTLPEVLSCFEQAVSSHEKLQEFTFPCSECGKPIQLEDKTWESAKNHLIEKKWGHGDCIDKKQKIEQRKSRKLTA